MKPHAGLCLLVRGCVVLVYVGSLVGSFSGSASKLIVVALVSIFPEPIMFCVGFVRLERAFNARCDLSRGIYGS
jgi:hypothetical protein